MTTPLRIREIVIRKANGAGSLQVLVLLNREFLIWVTSAFLLACPVAWYAMTRWMDPFVCKSPLSWWIFLLAGLFAFTIALHTVSGQSLHVAMKNPAETLRYD